MNKLIRCSRCLLCCNAV